MTGYKLAKIPPEYENMLARISKLVNKPESVVLAMCLSMVDTYFNDKQIVMDSAVHCPKDRRRKDNR